jgi:phosphoglycolate phosphatase
MKTVLFWDIDGTLLTTARAGVFSLERALEEVSGVGADLQGMATAGMTDYAIAEAALERVGHPADEETVQRFLRIHERQLPEYLHRREGHVMPGVCEVLEDMSARSDVISLLLTGNTEGGAKAKLAHYGLTQFFPHGGAFCVGPGARAEIARRALPLANGSKQLYVLGDTPADIECGKAIGARTIAVATGSYDASSLAAHEPWRVLDRIPDPASFRALVGVLGGETLSEESARP